MNSKNIPCVMKILAKHFNFKERTTLNRMRKNNKNVASVEVQKEMLPFNTSRKEREENQGVSSHAFLILISCLLSLRTQDKNTEKASRQLFAVAKTPSEIAKIPIKKLEKLIFSSGHYRKKARTLKHVSKDLIKRFNSRVPSTKEELLSIKGIGPKTANIVLAFAYNQQVLPIDTHCHRLPNRLGWVKTKIPIQTEKALEKILPKKYWTGFNGIFVLFGKTICQPISPWCSKCPIEKYCEKNGVGRSR